MVMNLYHFRIPVWLHNIRDPSLTLKGPRKILEQTTIYFSFLYFRENNAWHYMWIICLADDSHVMSSIIFSEKY